MNTYRWLTVMCLAASMPAYASTAFKPIELKDSEMANLRGRYVMPGRIISFGIVMSSTWTNSAGASVTGSATMQIDKSTVTPQFYVQITGSDGNGGTQQPNGTGTVVGGTGLGSGQGVTQSVRAAGDGNTANNAVDVNVTQNGLAPANYAQSGEALWPVKRLPAVPPPAKSPSRPRTAGCKCRSWPITIRAMSSSKSAVATSCKAR